MTLLLHLKRGVNNNKLLQNLYNASKYCLHIVPFYVVEERLTPQVADTIKPALEMEKVVVKVLDTEDIEQLSTHPEVAENAEAMDQKSIRHRIDHGWICMGVEYDNLIIAYMWCGFTECDDRLLKFKLDENSAYLTFAYTLKAFRGKAIAPYLRVELYKYLEGIGRHRFYSLSEYLNKPAVRFKQKLNARLVKLYLYVALFKQMEFRIPLKSYL